MEQIRIHVDSADDALLQRTEHGVSQQFHT